MPTLFLPGELPATLLFAPPQTVGVELLDSWSMGSRPMWWSGPSLLPWGRGTGKWWALGGPLVKTVGFLFLAGLLFRVLCSFPSSRAPALQITKGKCNLFNGEWIRNPSGPPYTNASCRFIDGHQNCMMNGRPDKEYLRWKWKPYGCDLPPFDAVRFLDSMRNKAWGLIGDSILRNQVQSFLCLLSKAEEPVEVYHDKEYKNRRWHFQSYNFTVLIVWAPFLIKSDVFENEDGVSTSEIQLHLDILDGSWTSQYQSFDYIIISGGQWFLKPAVYWENDVVVGCHHSRNKNLVELGFEYLYRKSLQKVFNFIISEKHKPVVFFRTWSPDHFENGEWFNGGTCHRELPYKKGEYREGYIERVMRQIELESFNKARAGLWDSVDVDRLRLMDTYSLSFLRPDGHVGPYRTPYPVAKGSNKFTSVQNDCLHWCVPGPIDAWNDLVMKMALDR